MFGGGGGIRIKGQKRIPLQAGAPPASHLQYKAGNENAGKTGGNQNGQGKDVHFREIKSGKETGMRTDFWAFLLKRHANSPMRSANLNEYPESERCGGFRSEATPEKHRR